MTCVRTGECHVTHNVELGGRQATESDQHILPPCRADDFRYYPLAAISASVSRTAARLSARRN